MGSTIRFAAMLTLGITACATTPIGPPPYDRYDIRPKVESKGKVQDSVVASTIAAQSRDLLRCYLEKPVNTGAAKIDAVFEIGPSGNVMFAEVNATSDTPSEELAPCVRGALLGLRFPPTRSTFPNKVLYSLEIQPSQGMAKEGEGSDLGPIADYQCAPVSCVEPTNR